MSRGERALLSIPLYVWGDNNSMLRVARVMAHALPDTCGGKVPLVLRVRTAQHARDTMQLCVALCAARGVYARAFALADPETRPARRAALVAGFSDADLDLMRMTLRVALEEERRRFNGHVRRAAPSTGEALPLAR